MKNKTKTNYLLGFLLSTFLIIGIINVTNGITIDTNPDISKLHTPSIFSLFLGNSSNSVEMSVATGSNNLDILNGLIVGKNNKVTGSAKLSVIGGGLGNQISASYAGIGGGQNNTINKGENGAIGGGYSNKIGLNNTAKNGVIAGGINNLDDGGGIILGGKGNVIPSGNEGGIILGGTNNRAGTQSLILGSAKNPISRAPKYSFIWNQKEFKQNSGANINAENGMLIGTYNPITGVSLVVSGATKLSGDNNSHNAGGIFVNSTGCIQFYDGNVYNTLGKTSENNDYCGINTGCQFGAFTLHNGDIVTAYSVSYTGNCQNASGDITCINGKMVDKNGKSDKYIFPYCYDLSPDPMIDVQEGYQLCTGLPENAEWVNQYFKQTKDQNGGYNPPSKTGHFSSDKNEECSYECKKTGYELIENKCMAICTGDEPGENTQKSSINPSEPTDWEYVNPGTTLKACQWTCTGDYEKDGNKCIEKIKCMPQENITFPNNLCAQGEVSNINIQIQDADNYTKSAYGTWSCDSKICSGYLPTATFNQEKSEDFNKISINKNINGHYVDRNHDSINFSGVNFTIMMDLDGSYNNLLQKGKKYDLLSGILDTFINGTRSSGGGTYPTINQNYIFPNGNSNRNTGYYLNSIEYGTKHRTYKRFNSVLNSENEERIRAKDGYIMLPGWAEIQNENANLKPGSAINSRMIELAGGTDNIHYFKMSKNIPTSAKIDENIISTNISPKKVWMWYDNQTIYYYSDAKTIYMNTDSAIIFSGFSNLKTISGLSGWDASKVLYMNAMFENCKSLTSLDISNWNTSNVRQMNGMFQGCSNLTTLDLSKWNTNSLRQTPAMFAACEQLKTLNIGNNFIQSGVNDMRYMFSNCKSLTTLDVSNWDTHNVTMMGNMFENCKSLTTLDVSGWNTSNVKNMKNMFFNCSSLTTLDVSRRNTSQVRNMMSLFANCSGLTTLDVSGWNTSNVGNWNGNYYETEAEKGTEMINLFHGCKSLTELDLSNWNTSNVKNMRNMFYGDTNLKTIYASENFKVSQVTGSDNMFLGDTNLAGGRGTKVSEMKKYDKTYAKLDCGTSDPGYFTSKDPSYSCSPHNKCSFNPSYLYECKLTNLETLEASVNFGPDSTYLQIKNGLGDFGIVYYGISKLSPHPTSNPNFYGKTRNQPLNGGTSHDGRYHQLIPTDTHILNNKSRTNGNYSTYVKMDDNREHAEYERSSNDFNSRIYPTIYRKLNGNRNDDDYYCDIKCSQGTCQCNKKVYGANCELKLKNYTEQQISTFKNNCEKSLDKSSCEIFSSYCQRTD